MTYQNREGIDFVTDPFYTSPRGYKLCLTIRTIKYTYEGMAVCVHLMRGEHDDNLDWPFTGFVKVELLNQHEDRNHYTRFVEYTKEYGQRVVDSNMNKGFTLHRFIDHQHLRPVTRPNHITVRHHMYLRNDILYFRVSATASSSKKWLECT